MGKACQKAIVNCSKNIAEKNGKEKLLFVLLEEMEFYGYTFFSHAYKIENHEFTQHFHILHRVFHRKVPNNLHKQKKHSLQLVYF